MIILASLICSFLFQLTGSYRGAVNNLKSERVMPRPFGQAVRYDDGIFVLGAVQRFHYANPALLLGELRLIHDILPNLSVLHYFVTRPSCHT